MRKRVGWIVDVQNDFMRLPEQGGRLYVRNQSDPEDAGAASIIPTVVDAVQWMKNHCSVLVYTGDWHSASDPEISTDPDYIHTFPPHCMGLSSDPDEQEGAAIIAAIQPENPLVLPRDATPEYARTVADQALNEERPVFLRKSVFSVFTGNPGTEALLEQLMQRLGDVEIVVIGVARDVCVTQAVEGMQQRGYTVTVVHDATWGLGLEPEDETYRRWSEQGRVVSLAMLLS